MRVAVTTAPGDTADRLCRLLEGAGHVPVRLPCIRLEAVPSVRGLRAAADDADWIVVTSRRAVEAVWPEGGMPARPAVAAVGPRTAEAAAAAGGRVEVVGPGGAAELRHLLAGRVAGRRVVFPHSRIADPATADFLRAEGADLVAEPAYDTIPVAPAADPVDAAFFASPSAVEGWMTSRDLDGIVSVAMGPTTAAKLAGAGVQPRLADGFTGVAEALRRSPV